MVPPITCHILDTTRGKPAADVECVIYAMNETGDDGIPFGTARTNNDGRIPEWNFDSSLGSNKQSSLGINGQEWSTLVPGIYKIRFHTKTYFKRIALQEDARDLGRRSVTFFPFVDITFEVADPPDAHYHVPLLLSNHGYSTYRGS